MALSIVAGLAYPLLSDSLTEAAEVALKGAGVGLLALAAALTPSSERRLLALVLGCGAAGDMLLEIEFMAGVAAFAVGHALAIRLYLKNRRQLRAADLAVPALLMLFGAAMPFVLLGEAEGLLPFLLYSLLLSAMAAAAWISRFARSLVGVGALLFVASDALIALRMSQPQLALGAAIWLLYFAGQLLIFLGVSGSGRGLSNATAVTPPPEFARSPPHLAMGRQVRNRRR